MGEINTYLNSIKKGQKFSHQSFQNETELSFWGDGMGDFEQIEKSATTRVLKDYIDHCKEQIELAEEALKLKEDLEKG